MFLLLWRLSVLNKPKKYHYRIFAGNVDNHVTEVRLPAAENCVLSYGRIRFYRFRRHWPWWTSPMSKPFACILWMYWNAMWYQLCWCYFAAFVQHINVSLTNCVLLIYFWEIIELVSFFGGRVPFAQYVYNCFILVFVLYFHM